VSYLDHIRGLNRHDLSGFRPLFVGGQETGWVRHGVAERLARFGSVFEVGAFGVAVRSVLATPEERTRAIDEVMAVLVEEGAVPPPRGERYPVSPHLTGPALFDVDRAHAPVFGIRTVGVHLNGFVNGADGLQLWVARRATDRTVAPGKLDNLVAGGRPSGLAPRETLRMECEEEAGIGPEMAARATSAGFVSYGLETDVGLKRDALFVYDLDLPPDFEPRNTDGEIAAFMLWPVLKVLETVRDTDDFKFNVPLVILDFAVRHGILTPETEPDYEALVYGLRRPPV